MRSACLEDFLFTAKGVVIMSSDITDIKMTQEVVGHNDHDDAGVGKQ